MKHLTARHDEEKRDDAHANELHDDHMPDNIPSDLAPEEVEEEKGVDEFALNDENNYWNIINTARGHSLATQLINDLSDIHGRARAGEQVLEDKDFVSLLKPYFENIVASQPKTLSLENAYAWASTLIARFHEDALYLLSHKAVKTYLDHNRHMLHELLSRSFILLISTCHSIQMQPYHRQKTDEETYQVSVFESLNGFVDAWMPTLSEAELMIQPEKTPQEALHQYIKLLHKHARLLLFSSTEENSMLNEKHMELISKHNRQKAVVDALQSEDGMIKIPSETTSPAPCDYLEDLTQVLENHLPWDRLFSNPDYIEKFKKAVHIEQVPLEQLGITLIDAFHREASLFLTYIHAEQYQPEALSELLKGFFDHFYNALELSNDKNIRLNESHFIALGTLEIPDHKNASPSAVLASWVNCMYSLYVNKPTQPLSEEAFRESDSFYSLSDRGSLYGNTIQSILDSPDESSYRESPTRKDADINPIWTAFRYFTLTGKWVQPSMIREHTHNRNIQEASSTFDRHRNFSPTQNIPIKTKESWVQYILVKQLEKHLDHTEHTDGTTVLLSLLSNKNPSWESLQEAGKHAKEHYNPSNMSLTRAHYHRRSIYNAFKELANITSENDVEIYATTVFKKLAKLSPDHLADFNARGNLLFAEADRSRVLYFENKYPNDQDISEDSFVDKYVQRCMFLVKHNKRIDLRSLEQQFGEVNEYPDVLDDTFITNGKVDFEALTDFINNICYYTESHEDLTDYDTTALQDVSKLLVQSALKSYCIDEDIDNRHLQFVDTFSQFACDYYFERGFESTPYGNNNFTLDHIYSTLSNDIHINTLNADDCIELLSSIELPARFSLNHTEKPYRQKIFQQLDELRDSLSEEQRFRLCDVFREKNCQLDAIRFFAGYKSNRSQYIERLFDENAFGHSVLSDSPLLTNVRDEIEKNHMKKHCFFTSFTSKTAEIAYKLTHLTGNYDENQILEFIDALAQGGKDIRYFNGRTRRSESLCNHIINREYNPSFRTEFKKYSAFIDKIITAQLFDKANITPIDSAFMNTDEPMENNLEMLNTLLEHQHKDSFEEEIMNAFYSITANNFGENTLNDCKEPHLYLKIFLDKLNSAYKSKALDTARSNLLERFDNADAVKEHYDNTLPSSPALY